ncbi:MAG TPA: flagellar hook protein FlgE [Gemmatimonadaceae bacterium]|nr:flagellar hook protein FlgE [Gemmatimonadaceae bacterium]
MLRSLFAGVSGLRNHQVRMDVIGNNVANVNTVAFKAGRVTFKEGFAQLLQGASRPPGDHGGINPIQVGLGMQIGSIDTLFTQGNIETTGLNTDLAIQGDSYFVVAKGNEHYYTRSGNFQVDADGRLVSPTNGFVVQGRMFENGVMIDGIQNIVLPFGQKTAASATTSVSINGNLDASAPPFSGPFLTDDVPPSLTAGTFGTAYGSFATLALNPGGASGYYTFSQDGAGNIQMYRNGRAVGSPQTGTAGATLDFGDVSLTLDATNWSASTGFPATPDTANYATVLSTATTANPINATSYSKASITVYDSLGTKHELKLNLWKADNDSWNWEVDQTDLLAAGVTGISVTGLTSFDFAADGTIIPPATLPTISFTPPGANPVSIKLDPGSGVNGLSQFAGTSTAVLRDQDGYAAGTLQNFSIDRTGLITGAFTNGVNVPLAQIALADFNNPSGLLRIGDNMYATSGNSGGAVLGYALEGSQSFVTSGALEMSNVDLAQEFTNMIVAQRGFQANSRVITSSDEMLQEVVNLKR